MSALSDKIASYSIEKGLPFEEAYANPPTTQTGSLPYSTVPITLSNTAPVYNSNGPAGGAGCWYFSGANTRLRSNSLDWLTPNIDDNDWSTGIWFSIDNTSNGSNSVAATTIFGFSAGITGEGFVVRISGSNTALNPNRINVVSGSATAVFFGPELSANTWYYVAVRKSSSSNNVDFYLNGNYEITLTNSNTADPTYLQFGNSVSTNGAVPSMSNFYYGPYSSVDETAISEIWATGSSAGGTDITIDETPATASAESVLPATSTDANILQESAIASAIQTEPTLAVEAGDHVEVTTSIPVSAEFPPATVSAEIFVNVSVDEPSTASVELINNIIVGGSNSVDFGAQEFFASAELVNPFLSEVPMTASAESGDHAVYVDPSYFNAVKQLNPFLYINDGLVASTINYGYQAGSFTRGQEMLTARDGGAPLNLVREGKSWLADGDGFNAEAFIDFTTSTAAQHPAQLVGNGNFALEFWSKPTTIMESYINMTPNILNLKEIPPSGFAQPNYKIQITIKNGPSSTMTLSANHLTTFNNWNHFVVNVYQSGINSNERLVQVWVNGAIKINENITFTPWTNTDTTNKIIGSDASGLDNNADGYFDEIAWYAEPLTNSQIVEHYQLIDTLSPDYTEFAEVATASADIGTHQFTVTSNAIPEIKEATASALLVTPELTSGRSLEYNANPATSLAELLLPELSLGNTASADPMIAYAESANAFHLNSFYADYVKTNINPYRYVTFDSSVSTEDIGTDNDYSVVATSVGGIIVNPDEGINGKSVKTDGSSYVTGGVILKESEWDDTWGTGQNAYHSSFWMEKAPEDNSTGLRVLWNLNGYLDNQHVILFHRQNKLHMQFNNGSGVHIDAVTTNEIDIFDGQRHFIVVAFDHTNNNNNLVNLYVDTVLVLTVDLGSYTGQTLNGTTFVGPNDETNNHPRLGVGCLITPFEVTALPVVPTNTRLILDEIYWAKTAINQTQVTNLYNTMPDKNNNDSAAEAMTASALMVDAAIDTNVNYVSEAASASALINEVTVIADRNIVNFPLPATASAEFIEAQRINNIIISADVFVASAIFNNAGAIITLSGGPMLASATLASAGIRINGFDPAVALSPWAAYLRATDVNNLMVQRGVN